VSSRGRALHRANGMQNRTGLRNRTKPPGCQVAFLASRGSCVGVGPCGGSDIVFWEDHAIFKRLGWRVKLYARQAALQLQVNTLRITFEVPLLSSLEYCGAFVGRNRRGALIAYNEPTVALLAPSRTIVRFDWPTPLPKYWRQRWALSRFQRGMYLFPSRQMRNTWLARHAEIPENCTMILPNAVDLKLFAPPPDRPLGRKRVGFAGQWALEKGLQFLIEAWRDVRRVVPDAELWLAGGASLWQRNTPPPGSLDLERQVQTVAGRDGIRAMGILPRERMPWFWSQVDVAVVPSACDEAFGLVVVEAMACGTPVIVSDAGALAEVAGPGGLVVPRANSGDLARALLQLLPEFNERQRLGRVARGRAEFFSPERRQAALLDAARDRATSAAISQPRRIAT
jgi:glycosyltransferase involved in cell wall biosynthesis